MVVNFVKFTNLNKPKNGIFCIESIGIIMYNICITKDKQATFRSK